jgi:ligand-binding sensor domain-containing protein
VALGCWLGGGGAALALEPGSPFDEYVHAAWPSVAHASALRSLVVARDGHLWIGTSEGLVRFDGTSMVTFVRQRAPGIADGPIEQMFEASDGALWVGSGRAGLSRLEGSTAKSLRERDGLPGDQVPGFVETRDGTVWVATLGGVARIARGSLRPEDASHGLPDRRVDAIAVDAGGTVWAGTRGGLGRWEPAARRWQPERGHPALAGRVQALLSEPDGTLWVGTMGAGLLARRGSAGSAVWRAYTTADGLGSNEVSALLRERGGRVWAATRNGGLVWRAGERFQPLSWPVPRCARSIEALAEDAEGALWIATAWCGLHRLQDRPVRAVTRRDGLPIDAVRGLNGAADGSLWIGTRGGGMARIAPGPQVAEPIACGGGPEACAHCWDISPGPDGAVWAVCENSELRRWDGRVMAQAPLPPGIDAADMVTVARNGAVWIARGDQVIRWQEGAAERVGGLEKLAGRRIPYQGPGGTMWIAADDGVAAWRDGRVVRVVRFAAGEPAVEVSNLHEDRAGALWIGTLGAGLRLVRGERAATISLVHGLPTDRIVQILEDDAGRLWLSSGKGLLSVPRRELEEVADGRRPRVSVSVYDGVDGVLMRADGFGHPAGWKDRDGRLWFATLGGVALVDPAALRARAPAPPVVVVQHLLVDGRRVAAAPPEAAVIEPGATNVEAVFSARSLAAADTIFVRYRLEGRDADWVEAGRR